MASRKRQSVKISHLFEQDGRYRYRFDIPADLRSAFGGRRTEAGTLSTRPCDIAGAVSELNPIIAAHKARIKMLRARAPRTRTEDADHAQILAIIAQTVPTLPPDMRRLIADYGGPEEVLWQFYRFATADAAATLPAPTGDPYDPDLSRTAQVSAARRLMEHGRMKARSARDLKETQPLASVFEQLGLTDQPFRFEQAANAWIGAKQREPSTTRRLRGQVRRLAEFFGNVPLASITSKQINAFMESLTVNTATQNQYLATVKALFAWAWRTDRITSDPTAKLERTEDRRHASETRRAFTRKELQAIVTVARARWGLETESEWTLLLLIAVYTGLRLGEAPGLLRADLVEHEGVWSINVQSNRYRRLKTAPSERRLPVHPDLLPALLALKGRNPDSDLLFPRMGPHIHSAASELSKRFVKAILPRAGIEAVPNVTVWHSIRHAWEKHMVETECPDRVRLALAGEKAKGRQGIYDTLPVWEQLVRWTAKIDPLGRR